MIRFKVYENGAPARSVNLEGAYLLGADHVPVRSEMKFTGGELICEPRSRGPAALAIMWPVKGVGRVVLETPRLLERDQPYDLSTELARGQLMRISQKREDWGLYDLPEGQPLYDQIDKARDLLVGAMTTADNQAAAKFGESALAESMVIGEALGIFQAEHCLSKRAAHEESIRQTLGCRITPSQCTEESVARLVEAFEFAALSFSWSGLQPKEGKYETASMERALQLLHAQKVPIFGTSLLSFEPLEMPQWLAKIGKDYEKLRDTIVKHLRTVLKSFDGHVRVWEIASGLHAQNSLRLSFEQIMELTRTASVLARQCAPKCQVILGIVLPWGEYYANDTATIPPMMYGEMALQGGVSFDGFGLQLQFGGQHMPQYVRDMMQISSVLDRFGGLGKPLHITCAGVPSDGLSPVSGHWHDEWNEQIQADWLRDFYKVALSKPFVESVTWQVLADGAGPSPWGGVLREDLAPKASFQQLLEIRKEMTKAK